jgi:hypothetical protein
MWEKEVSGGNMSVKIPLHTHQFATETPQPPSEFGTRQDTKATKLASGRLSSVVYNSTQFVEKGCKTCRHHCFLHRDL